MNNQESPRRQAKCEIRNESDGALLLDYLAARFSYHSRAAWEKLVCAGRVLVNGTPGQPDTALRRGDTVDYLVADIPEPAVRRDYRILHEDECLLVIDKPGNLPIHPAGKFFRHTLWGLLREDRPELAIHFVNRLDRETSGIVLVAKSPGICAACARNLCLPDARKNYTALVEGDFPERLEARGALVPDRDSAVRKKLRFVAAGETDQPAPGEASAAWTSFVARDRANGLSLVDIRLHSGRTHQIRATLLALGTPVVGDKLYGVDETIFLRLVADAMTGEDCRRLRMARQALHAGELAICHPATGRTITFHAPFPADMAACWLGKGCYS